MVQVIQLSEHRRSTRQTYFNRNELSQLLALYSSRVATGEWRDYAIDHGVGMAVFSIFRHTHEHPLYAIVKSAGGPRGPEYAVFSGRRRLYRGASLMEAVAIFDRA